MIPSHIVAEHNRRKERYLARERKRNRNRVRGSRSAKRTPNRFREFIGWDGEGPRDAGYALFGNSKGDEICHPYLGTEECIKLILESGKRYPQTIHVGFGFNYDVSMILKDLSWRHLSALKYHNRCIWRNYVIKHIPRKWFEIEGPENTVRIFDVQSFFGTDYVTALHNFEIGSKYDRKAILAGKSRRSEFYWKDIGYIRRYYKRELCLLPLLMDKLRCTFLDAGFDVRSWHGPGALARMAMRRNGVFEAKAESPVEVQIAAEYAFAGGRFELVRAGHVQGKVYNADLHSAYPSFARDLPNLARGKWRGTRVYEPGKFGVYRIGYRRKSADSDFVHPLFQRSGNGQVVWPYRVEGWYWRPEAELVKDDPDAVIHEGLVFDEDDENDRPFGWIGEYYRKRDVLKRSGNIAEYTFKLVLNSIYGQLAQRAGWDKKRHCAPSSHQLEWAGWITSACRAEIYKVARSCGDKLVSIDTDGIYALAPIGNLDIGDGLGQWEVKEYEDGIFWQSGVYALKTEDEWEKPKTRGITKGTYKAEALVKAVSSGQRSITVKRKTFVTYGLALMGRRAEHNTWQEEPVEYVFGGGGKRIHVARVCGRRGLCHDGIHFLHNQPPNIGNTHDGFLSRRHHLPWNNHSEAQYRRNVATSDAYHMYDQNELDPDDEWVTEYCDT